MESIEKIQEEIISEFELFSDWTEKYEYIIELGKKLPLISNEYKNENHKVNGCVSQVWLNSEIKDGKIFFTADSDAIITKGLISLLIRVFSNQKAEDIINSNIEFIEKIGLKEHLSPTRANGLFSMINTIKTEAKKSLY
jgi:cysteine desulfuration protein SufE